MQVDLDTNFPTLEIEILGVNEIGLEGGNSTICNGRDLPWLQDVVDENVWGSWAPTYRDVVVLDGDNVIFGVYNLTGTSLAVPANYDALRQLFLDAAATL